MYTDMLCCPQEQDLFLPHLMRRVCMCVCVCVFALMLSTLAYYRYNCQHKSLGSLSEINYL